MVNRERIKEIIRESGHTYESLGDEIGISPQAVSEIVSGRTRGKTARYALAVALGLSVEDLWPEVLSPADRTEVVPGLGPAPSTTTAAGADSPPATRRSLDLRSVERLAAVQATGLLGASTDDRLLRLVRIAHGSSNAAMAVLSIIDGHRQHIAAGSGLPDGLRRTYAADIGACPHVVTEGTALIVDNLSRDPRFETDRFLEDVGARAYLGVPVRDEQGHVLGALAVIDTRPRRWSARHAEVLRDLSMTTTDLTGYRGHATELARATSELAEVRKLFSHLVDQSGDVFWISHPYTSKVDYVNAAFDEVYGWPREKLVEDGALLEMIHPEDRARVAAGLGKQVLGDYRHEYRVVRRDGSIRWIRSRSVPIRDPEGETYRVSGVATDVTEEKTMEGFLSKALQRFYCTDPLDHEIFWQGDVDRRRWCFKAGDECATLFGAMPDPDHGWAWWKERIHPDDRERILDSAVEGLRLDSGLWQEEYRLADLDGRHHLVRGAAYFFRGAQPVDSIGLIEVIRPA